MSKYIVYFDDECFHIIECEEDFIIQLSKKTTIEYKKIGEVENKYDKIVSLGMSIMEKVKDILPEEKLD